MEEEEAEEESVDVCCENGQVEDHCTRQPQQERHNGIEPELEHSESQKQQNWEENYNIYSPFFG